MIYGKSGSGKSRSLKNFAPDEIFLINVVGKSWIYPAGNQVISKSLARELRPFHSAKSTQRIMKEVFPVAPSTVCEYTGMTDKNGTKIFEGDIIHWTNWNGEQKEAPVCYDQEWNRFCVWLNGAESMGVNIHLSTSGIEVIGSIHDGEGDYVQRG